MTSSRHSRRPQSHVSYNASPASVSHGQTQESSSYQGGMITEISDYFDKVQIHNVISCAANTDEKIKLVDFIIKNREVKHRLKKKKSPKVLELNDAAHRLNNVYPHLSNNRHKFKKSLHDLVEQEPSLKDTNPTISSLIDIGHESELVKKYKPFAADNKDDEESDESVQSEVEGTRLVFPVEEPTHILQRLASHGKLISLSSFSSSNGLKFGYTESLFRKKPSNPSGHGSPRVKQLGKVEESPSTLRNISRGSSLASYSLLRDQKRAKESLPLSRVPSSRETQQDTSIFSLGAKRLEKDIYRYLVKNEKKKTENKIVLDLTHRKEKMRDIEARAIMQYKQAKREDDKFSDYKDNFTMAIKTERARTRSMNVMNNTSGKSDTSQLSLSRSGSKGLVKFDQSKRNSKLIRKVDMDKIFPAKPGLFKVPFVKKRVSMDDDDLNESFNSYTEARLDCLYSETERLSKGVEDIEHKMRFAQDEGELKSLLRARDTKKIHLRKQTSKIEVLVKKKMTTAFA